MSCAKTSLPEYIHPSRGTPRESFLRAVSCVQVDDTPEISKKSCTPATYTSQNHKRWDTTGIVPEIFQSSVPERIAYLHLDLNAAKAEIAALEVLFDRIVPGGMIVFDDFGHMRYAEQHKAEIAWMRERGYAILELPTGQGLVVKR